MRFFSGFLLALLMASLPVASAFTFSLPNLVGRRHVAMHASPKETAAAMSEYLAKAHEAKLKAIKDVETKKAAEIEALKNEIKTLKSGAPPPPASEVVSSGPAAGSNEDVAAKLLAYQQFMAKYIVDSHKQKVLAVQAAERSAEQRFEAKLKQLMLNKSEPSAPVPAVAAATPAVEEKGAVAEEKAKTLYESRNAKVVAAAKAGKTRWGDKEVEKVAPGAVLVAPSKATEEPSGPVVQENALYSARNSKVVAAAEAGKSRWGEMEVEKVSAQATPKSRTSVSVSTNIGASLLNTNVNGTPSNGATANRVAVIPEVEAADHGLRADGGVGGPSLAERVSMGANLSNAPSATPSSLYEKRNANVLASAQAGKSRWGGQEIERVGSLDVSSPTVASATATATATDSASSSTPSSLYEKRNAKVLAEANAGKSRWGAQEIQRVESLPVSSSTGASLSATAPVPPEVEAADHGLRADGGVGGPSLAERVNLGARLFGN